ncbi:MAG: hypothetical protein IPJ18_16070 [Betaproteobacteria bacterium]|nr:hypothetical protein [Betaproteobacteria bacterium]
MSKSRKWVTSLLVAASMAVVGTASALDDALVASMTAEIVAALQNVRPNAPKTSVLMPSRRLWHQE